MNTLKLKLLKSFITTNVFSPSANEEEEIDLNGALKFSVENTHGANTAYLVFIKGSKSQDVAIPVGETRTYTNPAGAVFDQKAYIHAAANAGQVLVTKINVGG